MLGIVRTIQQRVRIALVREVTALMMRMAAATVIPALKINVRSALLKDQNAEIILQVAVLI